MLFLPWIQALNFLLRPRPMKLTAKWKIGDEWRHFRNISKLNVFILLVCQPHCFTNFSLFVVCRRKLLTTAETTVSLTIKIWQFLTWRMSWPIQKPRLFFCTDSRSTSLGVAEAGTLKPDFRALKCRNRVFFLGIPFCTLQRYQKSKNPVGHIDTLISQASKRRRFCQLWLVRNIVDEPHEIVWPDCKQCLVSADFLGCFWSTAFWCSLSQVLNFHLVSLM